MLQGAKGLPPFPRRELPIIDATIKMFGSPCLNIDVPRAEALADRIAATKEKSLDEIGVDKEVLASRECFADLLRELGVDPPTKISPDTGEVTYAFNRQDSGMKELLEHDDERVSALAHAKLGIASTINETRARRYAAMGRRGQPVPIYLNYAAAFSTRWSGGDSANWQNLERLPNKIEVAPGQWDYERVDGHIRKGEIRLCIQAPPGHLLVIADLSQIEARLLAWHAGQTDLVEAFRAGRDVYSEFIEPYYGYPISKKTPSERGTGKQLILSCGYQAGDATIRHTAALGTYGPPVKLTLEEAGALKQYYRSRNAAITWHWKRADHAIDVLARKGHWEWGPVAIDNGRVWLPNGAWLDYTSLHQRTDKDGQRDWYVLTARGANKIYSGAVTAHINSALARVVMTDAMLLIMQRYRIALTIHDELVLCVPEREAEEARDFVLAILTRDVPWAPRLPVAAEAEISEVYSK